MVIASLKNLIVEFGDRRVIDRVSVLCEEGAVIGLIGGNGAGKSTLLNVLSDRQELTAGERFLHPKVRIGYLLQNSDLSSGKSIIEELRSVVREGLEAIEKLPQTQDPKEYARLQAIIDATDAYQIDVRIKTVLNGMGFGSYDLQMNVADLSGGEQTRLALCKLLIEQPNLLLLDEPTNHLDFKTLSWLEAYINDYKGAVIVVSHDRFFWTVASARSGRCRKGALNVIKAIIPPLRSKKRSVSKSRCGSMSSRKRKWQSSPIISTEIWCAPPPRQWQKAAVSSWKRWS